MSQRDLKHNVISLEHFRAKRDLVHFSELVMGSNLDPSTKSVIRAFTSFADNVKGSDHPYCGIFEDDELLQVLVPSEHEIVRRRARGEAPLAVDECDPWFSPVHDGKLVACCAALRQPGDDVIASGLYQRWACACPCHHQQGCACLLHSGTSRSGT